MEELINTQKSPTIPFNQQSTQNKNKQYIQRPYSSKKKINLQQLSIPLTKSRKKLQNIYDDQLEGIGPRTISIKSRHQQNKQIKQSRSNQEQQKCLDNDQKQKLKDKQLNQDENKPKILHRKITFQNHVIQNKKQDTREVNKIIEEKNQVKKEKQSKKSNRTSVQDQQNKPNLDQSAKLNSKLIKKNKKTKQQVTFPQKKEQQIKIHYQKPSIQNQSPHPNPGNHISQHSSQQHKVSGPSSPLIKSLKSLKSLKSINGQQNSNYNQQFDRISRKTRQTFRSTRSSCQDYLGHIFNYYCKLSYAIGKDPTFDQIQQKVKMMTITNFMIFCRDFNIRQNMQRQKLVQIFKKNSSYQKYLTPQQFHIVVQNISQIMFKDFNQDRRFGRMLVFLEIHNSFSFVKKMNKLGVIFRLKNKRGIDVNISPKYTFKLTPNNGKCQQQIAIQVQQRMKLRKILKQQNIQWHRKNKLNKIDQLYKNSVKNKKNKQNTTLTGTGTGLKNKQNTNTNTNIIPQGSHIYNNNQQISSPILNNNKNNQTKIIKKISQTSQQPSILQNKSYYNPCQILTQRTQNTYQQIHNLKKKQLISSINTMNTINKLQKQQSQRYSRQTQTNALINSTIKSQYKQFRINKIISQAKNTIILQNNNNNSQINILKGSICMSRIYEDKQNKYIKQSQRQKQRQRQVGIGCIKKQNNISNPQTIHNQQINKIGTICKNIKQNIQQTLKTNINTNTNTKSKQIKLQQMLIQQQIKNIPHTILQNQIKPKHFIRATQTVDKQNTKQINQLEQMIGIKDQNMDQLLERQLSMEQNYQLRLSKVQKISY